MAKRTCRPNILDFCLDETMLKFVELFFLAAASPGNNCDTMQQEILLTHLLLIYLFLLYNT